MNQDEINTALEVYVKSQINIADNQEFSIDFNAGRAPNGPTATIDIRMRTSTAPAATRADPMAAAPKRTLTAVKDSPGKVETTVAPTPKADPEPEVEADSDVPDAADVEMEEAPEVDDDTVQADSADVPDTQPAAAAPAKPKATSIFSKNKAKAG